MTSKKIGTFIKIGMMAAGIIPTVWLMVQNVLSPNSEEEVTEAPTDDSAETTIVPDNALQNAPDTPSSPSPVRPQTLQTPLVTVPANGSGSPSLIPQATPAVPLEPDAIRRNLRQGQAPAASQPLTPQPLTQLVPTPAEPLPPPYLGDPSIVSQAATTLDVVQWNPELVAQAFFSPGTKSAPRSVSYGGTIAPGIAPDPNKASPTPPTVPNPPRLDPRTNTSQGRPLPPPPGVPPVDQLQAFTPALPPVSPSPVGTPQADGILDPYAAISPANRLQYAQADRLNPEALPDQLTLRPLPLGPGRLPENPIAEDDSTSPDASPAAIPNPLLAQNPIRLEPQPLDPCALNNPERSPDCPSNSESRLIRLDPPDVNLGTAAPAVSAGGSTIGTPSAGGAYWGTAGIGIGYQERARFTDREDMALGIGVGFGNPQRNVGIQLGVGLVDLSDILADGSVSIKLHRQIRPDLSVAVGANGFETWGGPDGGSSLYGVATKRWQIYQDPRRPFSQITVSAGLGGGQFRSEADINKGNNSINGFGSVGVRLAEPLTGIVEWTGQDLNLGVSFSPFPEWPLVTSLAVNDVTGKAGDGPRFTAGIGIGFSFLDWFR